MCGRYTLTKKEHDTLADRFEAKLAGQLQERAKEEQEKGHEPPGTGRFNVAPTQEVLAVVRDKDDAEREMRLLRWGLLPVWAKDLKAGYKMINAKAETILEKRTYKPLVGKGHHRCLILADGFYEWMKAEDPKQPRQPVRFTVDGGEPFAFAGLWTRSKIEDEWIESCTLITTNPNDVVKRVHDRMPVIFPSSDAEATWLDPSLEPEDALELCVPFPAERMESAPANPELNKVGGAAESPALLVAPA
ncbi:MAG TPA: SOS response-associated peptidase [Solirubrobacterales bacterium]